MKRSIATLLSLTMMFSILAQYPIAYGEEFAGSQPVLEETMAINQEDPQDSVLTTLPETEEGESAPQEEEPEEPVTSDQPSQEEKEEPEEEPGVQTPAPAQEEEYESSVCAFKSGMMTVSYSEPIALWMVVA